VLRYRFSRSDLPKFGSRRFGEIVWRLITCGPNSNAFESEGVGREHETFEECESILLDLFNTLDTVNFDFGPYTYNVVEC
jgi:hypothetical protein